MTWLAFVDQVFFFHGIATGRRQEAGRFMLCLRGRADCSSEVGPESLY